MTPNLVSKGTIKEQFVPGEGTQRRLVHLGEMICVLSLGINCFLVAPFSTKLEVIRIEFVLLCLIEQTNSLGEMKAHCRNTCFDHMKMEQNKVA